MGNVNLAELHEKFNVDPEVVANLFAEMVTKGACQFSVNEFHLVP